jgi:hypothetical protein
MTARHGAVRSGRWTRRSFGSLAVQLTCLIASHHGAGQRAQVNVPVPRGRTDLLSRGATEDRQELAHTRLKTMRPRS